MNDHAPLELGDDLVGQVLHEGALLVGGDMRARPCSMLFAVNATLRVLSQAKGRCKVDCKMSVVVVQHASRLEEGARRIPWALACPAFPLLMETRVRDVRKERKQNLSPGPS